MDDAPIKDNEAIYDAEIAPLMTKIIEICDAHGIPMVASFEYAPEMLCTSALTTVASSPRIRTAASIIRNGVAVAVYARTR